MIQIIRKLQSENKYGFTLNLESMEIVKKGISVAYEKTQNSFTDEDINKVIIHATKNDNTIGGWLSDNGKYYFDSVKIFKDNEMENAIKFGKDNNQIAIFDITNLKEIKL